MVKYKHYFVGNIPHFDVHVSIFIDCVAGEIVRLVASVGVSFCLSVGVLMFEPFDL